MNKDMDGNMSKNSKLGSFPRKPIIIFLIGLMIIVGIFAILIFYVEQIQITTTQNKTTVSKTILILTFNDKSWNNFVAKELLIGILGAAAVIVAVAFTITQLMISNIGERFTPHALEMYFQKNHHNAPFYYLIMVVASSTILLMTLDNIPSWIECIFITIVVELFLWSLVVFIKNYHDIFRVINPVTFLDYLKDETMKDIRGE